MFLTIALIATVIQFYNVPGSRWREALIYDRDAIAQGEWWRIWTGHLVHFGWAHFVPDAGLFVILGWLLESRHRLLSWFLLVTLPAVISGSLYFGDRGMTHYGGLSAVDMGLLVFLACSGWQKNWFDWFCPAVLAVYVAEIIIENVRGHGHGGGMIAFDDNSVHVATSAHVAAAIFAILVWGGRLAWSRRKSPGAPDP
ncbi:MAG: rhombosortase [Opitutaceae bacterium]